MTFERGRRTAETDFGTADLVTGSLENRPVATEEEQLRESFYRTFGKRALDIALVFLAAPVWVPLVALLALMVKLDGAPAFYAQTRVGKAGRQFRMWKLRSMVNGADGLLEDYLARCPAIRDEWNEKQKLIRDPRITRLGRFLRKTSLDELPQLWNVLNGDMSLVGPRPMMIDQKHLYQGRAYYALRPGVTGTWQVYARNKSSFADRVSYDEDYYAEVTLLHDLRLLARTAPVVLAARGV